MYFLSSFIIVNLYDNLGYQPSKLSLEDKILFLCSFSWFLPWSLIDSFMPLWGYRVYGAP